MLIKSKETFFLKGQTEFRLILAIDRVLPHLDRVELTHIAINSSKTVYRPNVYCIVCLETLSS